MSTMSIDGLISGMQTSSMIDQLIRAEGAQQAALKARVAKTQAMITAAQGVNSKLKALMTAAGALGKDATWTAPVATSSSSSVTAAAQSTARPGSLTFDVVSTAAAHTVATAEFTSVEDLLDADTGMPTTISITKGGTTTTLSLADRSVQSVLDAVNNAGLGLQASVVEVSDGTTTTQRIVIGSTTSGAASEFAVGGLDGPLDDRPVSVLKTASDAVLDLGGGVRVTRSSNTFSDVLEGVTFTVSRPETGVTVSVTSDPAKVADSMSAFVDALNGVLSEIATATAAGGTSGKPGPLAGDSTLRGLARAALEMVPVPVDGTSPAALGVQLDRYGRVTFDRERFLTALKDDPATTRNVLGDLGGRVETYATDATAAGTGPLAVLVDGRERLVRDLTTQIEKWDDRLALRRTTLQRQFSALEVALGRARDQSSWLAGQLASLPSYG